MVDVEVDRRVDEISASNRKLYMCTSSSKLHRSNSGQTKDLSPEPADRVNPKPRHFSIHKSWVIHIIIWYFFLITLISSAKQCYWRDYLRPKVIRDLNRGRSPTAGRFSWQFMGVLKKRKSGGGGDIFFSSAETSQLNNLLRGSAPGLVQKGEGVHGLNSQGANDVNGAQVKPRHNARIRNANILSDF